MRATSISLLAAVGLTALSATTNANAGFSGHSFGFRPLAFAHRGHGAFMQRRFDHRDFAFRRNFDHGRRFAFRRHFGYGFYGYGYYGSGDAYDSAAGQTPYAAGGSIVIYAPAAGYASADPGPTSSGPKIIVLSAEREAPPADNLPIVIYGSDDR